MSSFELRLDDNADPMQIPQLWRVCLPEDRLTLQGNRVARIAADAKAKEEQKRQRLEKAARKRAETAAKKAAEKAAKSGQTDVAAATATVTSNDMATSLDATAVPLSTPMAPAAAAAATSIATDSGEHASSQPKDMPFSLHPDDPDNFLKLSEALRILSQYELAFDDVEKADTLLRQYCTELITVRARLVYSSHGAHKVDSGTVPAVRPELDQAQSSLRYPHGRVRTGFRPTP